MTTRNAPLDLNLVRGFRALYETRSVSLAAERLGVTQGAMSKTLARLRTAFGDPLFVRTLRGFEPTPFAIEFAPDAMRAIDDLEAAVKRAASFDPARSIRAFTVLMSDIGQGVFLPPIVERLQRDAPDVSITVATVDRAQHYDAMQAAHIDLALGNFPHFGRELRQRALFDESFVCLAAQKNPIARVPLTREAFQSVGHAVVTPWGAATSYEEPFLERAGLQRRVAARVPSFLALVELVMRTDLIATIPSRAAKLARGRKVIELPVPVRLPEIPLKLYWHERTHRDAGGAWLRKLIVELFGESDRLD